MRKIALAAATLIALTPGTGRAQAAVGTGLVFQGYTLDESLGVSAANLLLAPVAVQLPLGRALAFDVYSAWARGAANIGGTEYTIDGIVDTRVRASWTVAPWAVLTAGLNVPTGTAAQDEGEALVASALSTELLGFREASWGLGLAATSGIATAHRLGAWGVGLGVSYRHAADYAPSVEDDFRYNPGDEVRLRLALDRNIGASKLTAGVTYQNFAEDRVDGRNLFQPGSRLRGDVSYAFRAGAMGSITAFGAAAWRERGDVLLDLRTGEPSTETVGGQVLAVIGLAGSVGLTRSFTVLPALDARWIDRDDPGGDGWLIGGGFDVPIQAGRVDVLPGGRARFGALTARSGESRSIVGGEVGVTVRFGR